LNLFLELLCESVIIRGSLALLSLILIGIMLICRLAVPGELWGLVGIAWGYFFGSGAHKDAARILAKVKSAAAGQ
jgi:hypothetical protein